MTFDTSSLVGERETAVRLHIDWFSGDEDIAYRLSNKKE
jgi:hypothetical protein